MIDKEYDVIVIGAGPGGLAAARAAAERGAGRVLLLERDRQLGGILNQCIHDGFGLFRYHTALTGPEYALRAIRELEEVSGVEILFDTMVTSLSADHVVAAVNKQGLFHFYGKAIVLATGCRERTRGNIPIPGTRPAGVFTAGVVQNLVNMKNIMVGQRVVILGSGDIGLIMARRLTLEGAKVLCVAEFLPDSGGLQRNIQQCLYDFDIPIYTRHSVSRIIGKRKLEAVEISEVDENGDFIAGTARRIDCDTLVLSVGLIPENEIASGAGVELDQRTNGALTDVNLMTSVSGIFSCGNCRAVMDLADFVSAQGTLAGANAAAWAAGEQPEPWEANEKYRPAKGIPAKGSLVCVRCPKGCLMQYEADGTVTGNTCDKGLEYALQEQQEPMRVLTTTILQPDGSLTPAKTPQPIPLTVIKQYAGHLQELSVPLVSPQ